jgi:hypothetical protein
MGVIDLFEVIKVEEQRRHRGTVATGAADFVQQKLTEITGIVQLSQIVGLREPFCFTDTHCIRECRSDRSRQRVQ